ncbi:MAG: hypothetical protein QOG84_298, partial [Sphingomonadales bacterium]|nr:hypothetical protein [Sphingomonadales bacterium]
AHCASENQKKSDISLPSSPKAVNHVPLARGILFMGPDPSDCHQASTIIARTIDVRFAFLSLLIAVTACGAEVRHHVVRAPNGQYDIDFETRDLGACCSSSIVGTLRNHDDTGPNKVRRIMTISGATEAWLNWRRDNQLEIYACNATRVEHQSDVVLSNSGAALFISVINLTPVAVGGARLCPPPTVPNAQKL